MNTMQQEFDAVVTHLYTQGRPAKSGGNCLYRSGKLSCAVGCRIPDAMYSERMEFKNVYLLLSYQPAIGYQLPEEIPEYRELFLKLQQVHDQWGCDDDGSYKFSHLAMRLSMVANEFGLTFAVPATE